VTFDGLSERCLGADGREAEGLVGWANPVEVVAVFTEPDQPSRIEALNTTTGTIRELARGSALTQSHAVGWVTCRCRRDATEPLQALVFSAEHPERGVRIEPGAPFVTLALFANGHRRTYLDRLSIDSVARPISVDAAYQLVLRGWDADGNPAVPQAVRWWSSDTTTAHVDSTGVVHPRRIGTIVVHVSAGGWRQDTIVLHVGPSSVTTMIAEDWSGGIGTGWVPFGVPQPFVAKVERGFALAPNGDSTYVSGVYATQALPTADGLGIEFTASVPRTRPQWQTLRVALAATDSADRRSWDLPRGFLPVSNEPWRSCGVQYPSTEGRVRANALVFSAGIHQLLRAPPSMYTGEWVRFRLQLFPDGRCGVAVNGETRAISERRVPIGDSATVFIIGISHHTRVLIGRFEAWTGVRRDIDWSVLDRDRQPRH
jgi:hypothetical protein